MGVNGIQYSDEIANIICARLADGESLRAICRDESMPHIATVMRWIGENAVLREQYARAREIQAEKMAEEILQIADDGINDTYTDGDGARRTDQDVIARSRLRVDARKWLASKIYPKKYGDRVQNDVVADITVTDKTSLTDEQLAAIALRSSE